MNSYIQAGEFKALVDRDDFEKLKHLKYHVQPSGKRTKKFYLSRSYGPKKSWLHWDVIGKPAKGMEVDHINGDSLDNKRSNLRFVTHQQNQWNRKVYNSKRPKVSKYIGVTRFVSPKKRMWWIAQIVVDYKRIRKYCSSEREAALEYNRAAREHHGEYAFQNKVD